MLKERWAALAPFSDAVSLLDFLHGVSGHRDEKDDIYADLVRQTQTGDTLADLAMELLWLGLWPGLDGVCRRCNRLFVGGRDDLVSAIIDCFTEAVHVADLDAINRVAATLVRNTERRVRDERRREWLRQEQEASEIVVSDLPDETVDTDREPSLLGLPAGIRYEYEVAAIRSWLVSTAGRDADLVIGIVVDGKNAREMAMELGITHAAANKRLQRALLRLREEIER